MHCGAWPARSAPQHARCCHRHSPCRCAVCCRCLSTTDCRPPSACLTSSRGRPSRRATCAWCCPTATSWCMATGPTRRRLCPRVRSRRWAWGVASAAVGSVSCICNCSGGTLYIATCAGLRLRGGRHAQPSHRMPRCLTLSAAVPPARRRGVAGAARTLRHGAPVQPCLLPQGHHPPRYGWAAVLPRCCCIPGAAARRFRGLRLDCPSLGGARAIKGPAGVHAPPLAQRCPSCFGRVAHRVVLGRPLVLRFFFTSLHIPAGMGEAYMDGDYEVDSLGGLLAVATANAHNIEVGGWVGGTGQQLA